ncbi:hypothetical protein CCO03_12635 [Comamonas serinivorans]|uniref:Secreted protein n=1 Tax=Comamonas serinivorans TaxID=1082851 RepID=A0A1Y0EQ44_9BURK|nr:hypothetical protein [Comamonas serinivorans]ARU05419.1 hypothetical protein CCO03_12635 [Comamonas serinivorans]
MSRFSTPRRLAALALPLVVLAAAGGAQAQAHRACMIEADKRVMLRPAYTAECYEAAKGVRRAVIHDRCEGVGKTSAYFGGNHTLLTWLPQCPRRGADAVCRGALDGDADVYYYDRGAGALDALAEQCEDEGGTWKALD